MRALQGRVSVMALAPQNQLGETTQERGRAHPGAGAGGPRAWVLHPRGRPGRGSGLGSARSGLGDFSPAWQRRFALRGEGHSGPGQALRAPFMDFGQGRLQGDTLAPTPAAGPPQAPPRPRGLGPAQACPSSGGSRLGEPRPALSDTPISCRGAQQRRPGAQGPGTSSSARPSRLGGTRDRCDCASASVLRETGAKMAAAQAWERAAAWRLRPSPGLTR